MHIIAAIAALSATFAVPGACLSEPSPAAVADDWRILRARLDEIHPNPYHFTDKGRFDAAGEHFLANVADMTSAEAVVGLAALIALVGDGHTWMPLYPLPFEGAPVGPVFRKLPIRFELFDDGLFVVGAIDDHAGLVGLEVVGIGSVSPDVALDRIMTLLPKDAINFSRELAPEWLMLADVLKALGIAASADRIEIVVKTDTGALRSKIAPLDADAAYDWVFSSDTGPFTENGGAPQWRRAETTTPLWREAFDTPFRIETIDGEIPYLQVAQIRNAGEKTFASAARDAAVLMKEHGAPGLIVDLRRCLGGNGTLNAAFMEALSEAGADARIAVLISRRTHSAGVMLVSALERRPSAKFFGGATADRPNHYGETNIFVLPNSGLPIIHASERYVTSDADDTRPFKSPDVRIPYLFGDYASGEDPTLEAALKFLSGDE